MNNLMDNINIWKYERAIKKIRSQIDPCLYDFIRDDNLKAQIIEQGWEIDIEFNMYDFISLTSTLTYKWFWQSGPSWWTRFALCSDYNDVNYRVSITDSDKLWNIANEIMDSFKFIK